MKNHQFNLLIGNIFLGLSFMPNFLYNKIALVFLGGLFCIGGMISLIFERQIERLERRAKHLMMLEGFDVIEKILKQMPREKSRRRKA